MPSQSSKRTSNEPAPINPALATFDHLPDSAYVRLPTVAPLFGVSAVTVWRWGTRRPTAGAREARRRNRLAGRRAAPCSGCRVKRATCDARIIGADAPGPAAPERLSSLVSAFPASLSAAGAAAARIDPPESETARIASARRIEGQGTTDKGDSDGRTAAEQAAAAEAKRYATLRARLALAGYALSRSDASDGPRQYFVGRWGMLRDLHSIAHVEAFAERAGVRHA